MQFDFNCKKTNKQKTHIQLLFCSEVNNFANNFSIQLLFSLLTNIYIKKREKVAHENLLLSFGHLLVSQGKSFDCLYV